MSNALGDLADSARSFFKEPRPPRRGGHMTSEICEVSARCDSPATTSVYRSGRGWLPACGRCSGEVKHPLIVLFHRLNPYHSHKCPCGGGHGRASETCGPCRCGARRGTY